MRYKTLSLSLSNWSPPRHTRTLSHTDARTHFSLPLTLLPDESPSQLVASGEVLREPPGQHPVNLSSQPKVPISFLKFPKNPLDKFSEVLRKFLGLRQDDEDGRIRGLRPRGLHLRC
jgi:hypothetical protein